MLTRRFWPPGERAVGLGNAVIKPQLAGELRQGDGCPVEGGEQAQRLPHLHAWGDPYLLQLHSDPVDELGAVGYGVQSIDEDRAVIRLMQPFQALDGGGLAGAVRTDHAEDAPALYGEAHVLHGHHVAVHLPQRRYLHGEIM